MGAKQKYDQRAFSLSLSLSLFLFVVGFKHTTRRNEDDNKKIVSSPICLICREETGTEKKTVLVLLSDFLKPNKKVHFWVLQYCEMSKRTEDRKIDGTELRTVP